jgi:CRISPR-associated protein Csm4
MAQWTYYRLEPKAGAGFHFGERGLEQEGSGTHCPSDTLFAALVATLVDLDGSAAAAAFSEPFRQRRSPFLLTSLFPCTGDLPLLPVPRVRFNLTERPGQRKLLKRLRYVSPRILNGMLAGADLDPYRDEAQQGRFLQDGRVWLSAGEQAALPPTWRDLAPQPLRQQQVWRAPPVDRVTIDRVSSASSVYRIGRTAYAPGCGLWLGVQWPGEVDGGTRQQLENLLLHLGDRGIGGERSVGYGQFHLDAASFDLALPKAGGPSFLTLSRYVPHASELPGALAPGAAYGLTAVSGWLESPAGAARRRRSLRMLVEGSVLRAEGRDGPYGCLVDVAPAGWDAHPVWRYGYACPVGVAPAAGESEVSRV